MQNESMDCMDQLVDALKRSQEYIQYQNLLSSLKSQPQLFQRVGEFRRRSLWVQMNNQGNLMEENEKLQSEFKDLQSNGLAAEFMAAEHEYCHLVKKLQQRFTQELNLETGFLNE